MALDLLPTYYVYGILLQLTAAILLLGRSSAPSLGRRLLATLFLLNTAVTTSLLVVAETHGVPLDDLAARWSTAFDTPTGLVILAYAFDRLERSWSRRAVHVTLGLAGILFLLQQPAIPLPGDPGGAPVVQLFAGHVAASGFHIALLLAVTILARGDSGDRWVALALAPRFLYWATHALLELEVHGLSHVLRNALFGASGEFLRIFAVQYLVLLLGLVPMAAALSHLARARGPSLAVTLTATALGPLTALMYFMDLRLLGTTSSFGYAANLFTLIMVRPFFVVRGLHPDATGLALTRPLLPAFAFGFTYMANQAGLFSLAPSFALLVASLVALTLYGALEALWPRLGTSSTASQHARDLPGAPLLPGSASAPSSPAPPAAGHPVLAPAASGDVDPDPDVPHWMRLLQALEGSDRDSGAPPLATWSQQGLAERTGISVKRVSELPRQLNDRATNRLDRYCPGWRDEHPGQTTLVTRHRGVVQGASAPRVYYRLTSLGERLRSTVWSPHATSEGDGASTAAERVDDVSPA